MVCKANVDENSQAALDYGIRNVPTVLFIKDGEVTDRATGVITKQILLEKMKTTLKLVLLAIIACGGYMFVINQASKNIDEVTTEYEKNIGKEVIFNKDIVKIVDYSILNRTYTLSNGMKVNPKSILIESKE